MRRVDISKVKKKVAKAGCNSIDGQWEKKLFSAALFQLSVVERGKKEHGGFRKKHLESTSSLLTPPLQFRKRAAHHECCPVKRSTFQSAHALASKRYRRSAAAQNPQIQFQTASLQSSSTYRFDIIDDEER